VAASAAAAGGPYGGGGRSYDGEGAARASDLSGLAASVATRVALHASGVRLGGRTGVAVGANSGDRAPAAPAPPPPAPAGGLPLAELQRRLGPGEGHLAAHLGPAQEMVGGAASWEEVLQAARMIAESLYSA
jgi:hypothetical protein